MKEGGSTMNKPSYKIVSIADIVDWNGKNEIVLNPNYQRNRVWEEKSKSYLIDSIVRNLPIPPIFIRQTIDVDTRKITREVLDGQQRISTIIDYVNNLFFIFKSQNDQYGNMYYNDLPDEVKEGFLNYEIFTVIINEKDDEVVYDMFSRLNTNNYALTPQEIRNAKYWGEFKMFIYKLSSEYRTFFTKSGIFSQKKMSRQEDAKFISILINYIMNGVTTDNESSLNKLYSQYDSSFQQGNGVYNHFKEIMDKVEKLWNNLGSYNCFRTTGGFYSLFVLINEFESKESFVDFGNINKDNFYTLLMKFSNDYVSFQKDRRYENTVNQILYDYEKLSASSSNSKGRRIEKINKILDYIKEVKHEIV